MIENPNGTAAATLLRENSFSDCGKLIITLAPRRVET